MLKVNKIHLKYISLLWKGQDYEHQIYTNNYTHMFIYRNSNNILICALVGVGKYQSYFLEQTQQYFNQLSIFIEIV